MKRSEVIDAIWKYIQSIETDYDIYLNKDNCVELLALIEMLGMKPPNAKTLPEELHWDETDYQRWDPEE